ncbi:copper chaperone PCu(A)C [Novosphingobium profundi]|uniref:copper chaperone PCu(A)C n=1 Tax=Novosphingobium profundi TaxID=1774954 RepID=UPI001BDA47E6|nr:copper chaperone PCu(A)C [Novosphingobium profundi]MBT0668980.1 copper chaperone PCu(A)C [Novosphingobium profundi]
MQTRKIAAFSALSLAVLSLAACQKSPEPTPSESATGASEALGPDAKPGTSAKAGRLVLPVVAGRPAAVYFSFTNSGDKPVALASIHIDGADSAEMHKTEGGKMSAVERLAVAPGETVTFTPGGYHVMAFDLDTAKLASGGTTEMTITFEDGDKISMPLAIEKMGAGMDTDAGMAMDHASMDHGAMDTMQH